MTAAAAAASAAAATEAANAIYVETGNWLNYKKAFDSGRHLPQNMLNVTQSTSPGQMLHKFV
jgi:hypothetical protein